MRLPIYFVNHGAPNVLLYEDDPLQKFLKKLGKEIRKKYQPHIKGILVISAHWEAPQFRVNSSPFPETIYDFYGFEPALYKKKYPSRTSPELYSRVCELLSNAGLPCQLDSSRGYDHGCWPAMMLMFPEADIPVVQFALQHNLNPAEHVAAGKALEPLRDEGFLVIGSGSATHNLRSVGTRDDNNKHFDKWLEETMTEYTGNERNARLQDVHSLPSTKRAHPTIEHYLPAAVAAAAAGESKGKKIFGEWIMYNFSLAAYCFE